MVPTLREYIADALNMLQQRRQRLQEMSDRTTNPLDRLAYIDMINEINLCLDLFSDWQQVADVNDATLKQKQDVHKEDK